MKEKTPKEEKAYMKIRRYIRKLFTFIGVKFLFLWEKTSKLRKMLKVFFENGTTKSIIQLFLLLGTIAVLLVANKQRRVANEQQEITIKLQNIANEQLVIAKERQQWLREDRRRIADVYLEMTSVKSVDPAFCFTQNLDIFKNFRLGLSCLRCLFLSRFFLLVASFLAPAEDDPNSF